MIRLAIVEDDPHFRELITGYIKQFEEHAAERFAVTQFEDGSDIVDNYKPVYDIILMDVEMQFMNGMAAAEQIRKHDREVVIIFLTNAPQYATMGYAIEALDYVLKPINYFALEQRLEKAILRIKARQDQFITIKNNGSIAKLFVADIYYIEVQNHNLKFFTRGGDFYSRLSMKEIEQSLNGAAFARCSNSYLVNLAHVDAYSNNEIKLSDGTLLAVSRTKKKAFLDALDNYFNGVI